MGMRTGEVGWVFFFVGRDAVYCVFFLRFAALCGDAGVCAMGGVASFLSDG